MPSPLKTPAKPKSLFTVVVTGTMLTYLIGCTTLPSGKPAFSNFNECMAANTVLAGVGGIAAGIGTALLTEAITGKKDVSKVTGVVAGIAAAVKIGMEAWDKCAAEYPSKSNLVAPPPASAPPVLPAASGQDRRRLAINTFDLSSEQPGLVQFSFVYYSSQAGAKDIRLKLHHKVEIVKFDREKGYLLDAQNQPLLDASGKPVPLSAASTLARSRLAWNVVPPSLSEGYTEELIVQEGPSGVHSHELRIPEKAQLPLPVPFPMRYTLTLEDGESKASRTLNFNLMDPKPNSQRYSTVVVPERSASFSTSTTTYTTPSISRTLKGKKTFRK